jgi:hypothetical protein
VGTSHFQGCSPGRAQTSHVGLNSSWYLLIGFGAGEKKRGHERAPWFSQAGVLHDEPGFSEIFISHLLARTIRVEEDLVDQLFDSSEKRLARLLFLLANFGKEGRPEPIIAKISQERLAEMIGTTRTRELLHEQISGVGLR